MEARARRELAGYYAHLEATDRAIGRLVASIPPAMVVRSPLCTATCTAPLFFSLLFRKGWPHEG